MQIQRFGCNKLLSGRATFFISIDMLCYLQSCLANRKAIEIPGPDRRAQHARCLFRKCLGVIVVVYRLDKHISLFLIKSGHNILSRPVKVNCSQMRLVVTAIPSSEMLLDQKKSPVTFSVSILPCPIQLFISHSGKISICPKTHASSPSTGSLKSLIPPEESLKKFCVTMYGLIPLTAVAITRVSSNAFER